MALTFDDVTALIDLVPTNPGVVLTLQNDVPIEQLLECNASDRIEGRLFGMYSRHPGFQLVDNIRRQIATRAPLENIFKRRSGSPKRTDSFFDEALSQNRHDKPYAEIILERVEQQGRADLLLEKAKAEHPPAVYAMRNPVKASKGERNKNELATAQHTLKILAAAGRQDAAREALKAIGGDEELETYLASALPTSGYVDQVTTTLTKTLRGMQQYQHASPRVQVNGSANSKMLRVLITLHEETAGSSVSTGPLEELVRERFDVEATPNSYPGQHTLTFDVPNTMKSVLACSKLDQPAVKRTEAFAAIG